MTGSDENITSFEDHKYQQEVYAYKKQIYEDNMRLWESFNQTSVEAYATFDKSLFTVAAGSFGISFAFIDKFVAFGQAAHPALLIVSWACFALCLIAVILGHFISAESYRKQRDEVAQNMILQFDGKPAESKPIKDMVSPCNYIGLISYIGGIVCLLFFVLLNL